MDGTVRMRTLMLSVQPAHDPGSVLAASACIALPHLHLAGAAQLLSAASALLYCRWTRWSWIALLQTCRPCSRCAQHASQIPAAHTLRTPELAGTCCCTHVACVVMRGCHSMPWRVAPSCERAIPTLLLTMWGALILIPLSAYLRFLVQELGVSYDPDRLASALAPRSGELNARAVKVRCASAVLWIWLQYSHWWTTSLQGMRMHMYTDRGWQPTASIL